MIGVLWAAVAVVGAPAHAQTAATAPMLPIHASSSVQEPAAATLALDEGMRAFNAGDMPSAIKLLSAAADEHVFLAQYYLARIYSTRGTRYANRAAAYQLYNSIAVENADRDPEFDFRAPFVARSELELARYLQTGIPELSIAADPIAARDHLVRAAQIFGDADAQFELAKLDLANADTQRAGLDLLETVADQRGHAGALAFLSQLWLTGRYVGSVRPSYAFAYASLAIENAPVQDRIWIKQNFQRVFCATTVADREQGAELLPQLRDQNEDRQSTPADIVTHVADDDLAGVTWRCRDGEVVTSPVRGVVASAQPAGTNIPGDEAQPGSGYRPAAGNDEDGISPAGMTLEQLEMPTTVPRSSYVPAEATQ
jgi:uncharacterized protein